MTTARTSPFNFQTKPLENFSVFNQSWNEVMPYAQPSASSTVSMRPTINPTADYANTSGFNFDVARNMQLPTESPFLNMGGFSNGADTEGLRDISMPNATADGYKVGNFGERSMDFWNKNFKGIGAGIGAVQGLVGAYSALKGLDLAKDSFNFQKETWNKQFDMQKRNVNDNLMERQRYRHNNYRDQYESPEAYVARYGVK